MLNPEMYLAYVKRLYGNNGNTAHGQQLGQGLDSDVVRMLQLLLRLTKPKNILEIGTSYGFAACAMAQVVKEYGGMITTVEFDSDVARQAVEGFRAAGVDQSIEIIVGDARNVLPAFKQEFDFIFQDANKRLYPQLFTECVRLLRPGGLLVAEDTLFPIINLDSQWHGLATPIAEFNQMVAEHPNLCSTVLPIGDGLSIAVKI